ncbi:MAG: phosphomannomutase [Rhodobacteraceae bacterium]|nr:phosphomannomutase [Paracoccaceae bacterium]
MRTLTCFKSYDIRGKLGDELNEDIAYAIAAAIADIRKPKIVVLGADSRPSSEALKAALVAGFVDHGVNVLDLGMCGTEEVYFATTHLAADLGIEVTASHNPIDYNGMKIVGPGSRPLDPLTEMEALRQRAETGGFEKAAVAVTVTRVNPREAYAAKVISFVDISKLKPLKILVNAGNGTAGPTFDVIKAQLLAAGAPLEFVEMDHTPDPSFPKGIPNPLLPENQPRTAEAVRAHGADFGVAWDGDFDRCFFFDENGQFIDGYYIVGLLAQQALSAHPGASIIHDPRLIWDTIELVEQAGGTALQSRVGHSHIKALMRESGAIYGGEMSAHHYFTDFMRCDSGMIPWLLIAELVSTSGNGLAALVAARQARFPTSGEQNFTIADPAEALKRIEAALAPEAKEVSHADGLSLDFGDWRMNVRPSGTEPLVRLNIESRGDPALVARQLLRIQALLETFS